MRDTLVLTQVRDWRAFGLRRVLERRACMAPSRITVRPRSIFLPEHNLKEDGGALTPQSALRTTGRHCRKLLLEIGQADCVFMLAKALPVNWPTP